ncbi:MAG TPA: DUF1254 domain-containing protein [Rhizomicrobium sp.]|nr:DUF1254 domain-containing protein [Rhizomicrobium sp.]
MTWFKNIWRYVVLALVTAFAVHLASVALIPRAIMIVALHKMSSLHGYNTMTHSPRATSASRAVVRPSPDLLYSACPFDLDQAGGMLHVHTEGMPNTYWSVSIFDAQTDNIFALNDRDAHGGGIDFILKRSNTPPLRDKTKLALETPTPRGLILIRTLIDDDRHLAAIDAARRHAACEPYTAPRWNPR